jgi:cytochrome P450
MPAVDLDLKTLAVDPHTALARVRAEGPAVWVPAVGGWMVTRYAEAVEVLRDPERFTVDDPRFSTAQVVGRSMLSTDGPLHRHHRDPFVGPLRRSIIETELAPVVDRIVDAAIRRLVGAGSAELRADLAAPVAVQVMAELTGLTGMGTDRLLGLYRRIAAGVDDLSHGLPLDPDAVAAFDTLRTHIAATDTAPAIVGASHLTADDLAANVAVVLFGGIETGEGMNATALWYLLSEPDLLERCTPELIPRLVEEAIRLEPPAARVDRYATDDVQFGDAHIGAGDLVVVSITAANRDPGAFEHPDRFRLDRPPSVRHLSFATGPHACIGAWVARTETAAVVGAVANRLGGVRLDADRSRPHRGLVFRKPEAVWARWDVVR